MPPGRKNRAGEAEHVPQTEVAGFVAVACKERFATLRTVHSDVDIDAVFHDSLSTKSTGGSTTISRPCAVGF